MIVIKNLEWQNGFIYDMKMLYYAQIVENLFKEIEGE